MKPNIFLIGFMGTGKTTLGQILADQTGMTFIDMDAQIEERTGKTIADIFKEDGETWFRKKETEVLAESIIQENQVFSTGGGIVLRPRNKELMKNNGIVIALKANINTIWERLKNTSNRPLLNSQNPKEALQILYQQRIDLYDFAHISIQVDGRSQAELIKEITAKISLFNSAHIW
ncbi:MAG TPA: shikimate kinase [Clostridiales bacterium]|nr:shikimate kinase [Clostridiales bacterium]